MKKIFSYIFIFLIIGCNSIDSPEQIWEQVKTDRTQKDLQKAITNCNLILNEYPKHEFASKALFQIGDIYLNDMNNYDFAIEFFNEVLEKYPLSKESEKAAFMIGYIYANNLDSYSDAEISYMKFLELYPKSDLVQSVEYELQVLEPLLKTIDSLNSIIEKEK